MRPVAMAAADLDADSMLDLVGATPDSGIIVGWGGEGLMTQLSLGRRPVDVEVVDLDGDAIDEIVVLHQTPAEVEAFRLVGSRDFASIGVWTLEGLPHRFALAHLDKDGSVDAVIARTRPSGLVTLTKGFTASTSVDFGTDVVDVTLGDLDSDSAIDALAVDVATGSLHVLENYGESGFAAPRSLDTGVAPEFVAMADFNADGHPDVATSGRAQANLAVHLGDGKGGLSVASSYPTGSAGIVGFALVHADAAQGWLVTAESDRLTASEIVSDGTLTRHVRLDATPEIERVQQDGDAVLYAGRGFVSRIEVAPGLSLHEYWRDRSVSYLPDETRIVSGDVDGDAITDLVLAQAAHLQIYLGRADGSFINASSFNLSASVNSMVAGDVTGDGRLDLVIGTNGSTPELLVAVGGPDGTFAPTDAILTDSPSVVLASIDPDGDSVHAVVAGAGVGGTVAGCEVLHFTEDGALATSEVLEITSIVEAAQATDLDGDGGQDLLVLTRSATGIQLVTIHANGALGWDMPVSRSRTSVAGVDATETVFLGLAAGDVDGDGRIDGLLSHSTGVEIFLDIDVGEVEPVFSALALDEKPAFVSLVDVDADGKSDLLYAGSSVLVAARGSGDGLFEQLLRQQQPMSAAVQLAAANDPQVVVVVDDHGLAAGELALGPVSEDPDTYRSLGKLSHMKIGDINGDDRPDIVVASQGSAEASRGVGVLWNSSDGQFDRGLTIPNLTAAFTTADMDQSGGDEIVTVEANGMALVYYHDEGRLKPRSAVRLPPFRDALGIEAGHRDADGFPDVVVLTVGGEDNMDLTLVELLGANEHQFAGDANTLWTGATVAKPEGSLTVRPMLVAADFDADGRVDAAVLPGPGKTVVLAWGAGSVENVEFESDIMAIGSGDMHADGGAELLLGYASQIEIVSLNGRRRVSRELLDIAGSVGPLTAVDADGAPPIDLLYRDQYFMNVALRHQDGGSTPVVVDQSTFQYSLADLNLDSRADIVKMGSDSISIYLSQAKKQP